MFFHWTFTFGLVYFKVFRSFSESCQILQGETQQTAFDLLTYFGWKCKFKTEDFASLDHKNLNKVWNWSILKSCVFSDHSKIYFCTYMCLNMIEFYLFLFLWISFSQKIKRENSLSHLLCHLKQKFLIWILSTSVGRNESDKIGECIWKKITSSR